MHERLMKNCTRHSSGKKFDILKSVEMNTGKMEEQRSLETVFRKELIKFLAA